MGYGEFGEPFEPADGCDGSPWCDCVDCARSNVRDGDDELYFDGEVPEPAVADESTATVEEAA